MTFGIESSNIVGYTTKEAAQGKFIILGAQFKGVKGGTKINDLISGVVGVDYDTDNVFQSTAAQIQVPKAGGYDTYYYLNDGYDLVKDDGTTAPGWCDMGGNLVDVDLVPGIAVWAKSVLSDASINVSGAVSDDDTADVDCPTSFALRANVFPIAVALNGGGMTSADIVGVNYDESNAFQSTAAQIQVPKAGGYDTYYYLNDGYDLVKDDGTTAPGWCDMGGNLATGTIPAAQGFWTKGVTGAFTLTFTR